MAFALHIADFDALPASEQVRVVTQLWDRVAAHPERVPVTEAQVEVLQRRMAAYERDPSTSVAWEDLENELLGDE